MLEISLDYRAKAATQPPPFATSCVTCRVGVARLKDRLSRRAECLRTTGFFTFLRGCPSSWNPCTLNKSLRFRHTDFCGGRYLSGICRYTPTNACLSLGFTMSNFAIFFEGCAFEYTCR